MTVIARVDSVLTKLEKLSLLTASVTSFLIMGIVSVDVACRYLLGSPLGWAFEFISLYLTVSVFFLAMPATFTGNHNVRVDILVRNAKPAIKDTASIVSLTLTTVFFIALLFTAANYAWVDWSENAAISGDIPWPTWIPPAIVTMGTTILILRLVWCLVSAGNSLFNNHSDTHAPENGRRPY